MTEADKIEELAKWFEDRPFPSDWGLEQAAFLRSLSARLNELEEAKEALEWLAESPVYLEVIVNTHKHFSKKPVPPYLRKRLGKEG